MKEPLVAVDGVTIRRGGRDVVRTVSLRIDAGERVALVGPNAAGKSTFLAGLAGLLPVGSGEIRIDGRSLGSFSGREAAREIALVVALQENAPRLSVRESVELGRYPHAGPLRGLSSGDREAINRSITETHLSALAERTLASLSAGERQRALIGRALAQEPKLLLLDEPSAHLDVGHALDLFALLTTIAARGVAIIAVIHDLPSAARWATRMVVMNEGHIVADGPPGEVMREGALGEAFGVSIGEARTQERGEASAWTFERRPGR